jgi:drug/metabolite transporter (DMT)-like permease
LVYPAAALVVILWSSSFIAIRYDDRHFGPGELALGRLIVASLCLAVPALWRWQAVPRRAFPGTLACGLLWFGFYNVALNAAERHLDAGIAALIMTLGPIFITILAGVLLREGFPRLLVAGCTISFAGIALIGIVGSSHHGNTGWGVALGIMAALAYASGVVAEKPVLKHASALTVTWLGSLVGLVVCLPYAPSLIHQLGDARVSQTLWMVYLGVGSTATGFLAWAFVLSRMPAGRLAPLTYLLPPIALLLAWPILSETPPWVALPGGILCIAGVAITRKT